MLLPDQNLRVPFVDWLSFSIEYGQKSFDWIETTFGTRTDLEKGFNGYTNSFLTDFGAFCGYSPNNQRMKIHVSLSSKALFNLNGKIGIDDLIKQIILRKGTFSRIDISMDDYDGILDISEILEKLKNQEVLTRFRGCLKIEAYNPQFTEFELISFFRDPKRQKNGQTVYIGDWHSDIFCRIYDKKKQTKSDVPFWTRVEFQLRHKVANEFCNPSTRIDFKTGEIKSFDGSFNNRSFSKTAFYYIKFLNPSYKIVKMEDEGIFYLEEKHKRHWNACGWWIRFLKTGEGESIGLPKNETGLEEIKAWQIDKCSGADYLLLETYGEKYSHEKLLEGRKKFEKNKKYQKLLKEFQERNEFIHEENIEDVA